MSFATKCVCDGCGKIKGDANKWLLGYDFLLLNPKGSDVSFSEWLRGPTTRRIEGASSISAATGACRR